MFGHSEMILVVVVLLALVFAGVHIAIALGVTAAIGIYLMTSDIEVVRTFVANTAYEALRDYVFAVIPLFMLMGDFLAKCGAATDLYTLAHRMSRWLPARLAVATIIANAIFAFVTGVSIAAAAAFSRIAYPEMRRYGYSRQFALGCIAGSACLGMLIPPSVLMIVWGVLTELSIGKLFLAGVLPGLLLAFAFCLYVVIAAIVRPELVGEGPTARVHAAPLGAAVANPANSEVDGQPIGHLLLSTALVLILIAGVLGSIWLGFCTPTEGAGVGAVGALILALIKGITWREIWQVVLNVGRTSGPLLLLLFCAQLYSRVLSMTGFTETAKSFLLGTGLGPTGILVVMLLIWFVLGCLIDSISIILLTVPIFAPIAATLGIDPLAFAIIGILAIETGLLTPPFGILVFTVIFRGAIPYWIILFAVIVAIATFPQIATYLPRL
jgi:C4-dicarboxylate transporter DctM subunit